jgi:hypothetical protein
MNAARTTDQRLADHAFAGKDRPKKPSTPPPIPPRPGHCTVTVKIELTDETDPASRWELRLWLDAPEDMGGGTIESVQFVDDSWRRNGDWRFKTRRAAERAARKQTRRLSRVAKRWLRDYERDNRQPLRYETTLWS